MKFKNLRALIVTVSNNQDAYGIVTHTDVVNKVVAYGKDSANMRVYEIMTKPCIVINPDLGVEYIARLFTLTGVRIAPVIQEDLLGIVSEADILYKGDFLENPKVPLLRRELDKAIENAIAIAQTKGATSTECIDAWALVEDLEAETTYQEGAKSPDTTPFQQFCLDNPEILQVRHNQAEPAIV
ncbi:MAG: CBS domain-containing protein [Xenococcus sp. MO_188.B8]|nr:CBS domain-containing protein [Xenococcus sp. MO_188.B8]